MYHFIIVLLTFYLPDNTPNGNTSPLHSPLTTVHPALHLAQGPALHLTQLLSAHNTASGHIIVVSLLYMVQCINKELLSAFMKSSVLFLFEKVEGVCYFLSCI